MTDCIKRHFELAAKSYSKESVVQRTVARDLMKIIPLKYFSSVLEIGCGSGFLSELLVENDKFSKLSLVDISSSMIEQSKKNLIEKDSENLKKISYFVTAIEKYSVDSRFDLIVSSSSLHWSRSLEEVFLKIKNLISQDGSFCFSIMLEETLKELMHFKYLVCPDSKDWFSLPTLDFLKNIILELDFKIDYFQQQQYFVTYSSTSELIRSLKKQGVNGISKRHLSPKSLKKLINLMDINSQGSVLASYNVGFFRLLLT